MGLKGKDLALAFGIKVGFGRLGTFAALQLSPVLAKEDGTELNIAIWLAAILVCISLLVFIIYMLIDIKYDKNAKETKQEKTKEKFQFADILNLLTNKAYIFIALLCVTFYSAVFPFLSFAPDFFLNKFNMTSVQSGQITSLLPLGTLIFTPLFGLMIDRKGKSATAMIFGALALLIVHLCFATTNIAPYVPMVLLGIGFSLVPAAMWPSMVKNG